MGCHRAPSGGSHPRLASNRMAAEQEASLTATPPTRPKIVHVRHPDQVSRRWRLVGARCAAIRELGPAGFAWEDGQGSRMSWEVAERSPRRHVWYAEGELKAGTWLPRVSVKAVLVADHAAGTDGE